MKFYSKLEKVLISNIRSTFEFNIIIMFAVLGPCLYENTATTNFELNRNIDKYAYLERKAHCVLLGTLKVIGIREGIILIITARAQTRAG